eukprot:jgi/Bigna1/72336/fgenesh1_pg.19_\
MTDLLDAFENFLLEEEEKETANPFKPPPLLWDEIRCHIQVAEQDLVRAEIGEDLIKENLLRHQEASNLAVILQELHADNQKAREKLSSYLQLTEKMEHKILRTQIQSHMNTLLKRLKRKGSQGQLKHLISTKSDSERSAMLYSLRGSGTKLEAEVTAEMKLCPEQTPPSTSRPNSASMKRQMIHKSDLDVWNVGKVVDNIREVLLEEQQALDLNLQNLKSCLANETQFRVDYKNGNVKVLPKVSELRQLHDKIKGALEEQESSMKSKRKVGNGNIVKKKGSSFPQKKTSLSIGRKQKVSSKTVPVLKPLENKESGSGGPDPTVNPTESLSQTSTEQFKATLVDLLRRVNPRKLKNVDLLMDAYKGKERELLEKIRSKYLKPKSISSTTRKPKKAPIEKKHAKSGRNPPQSFTKNKLRNRLEAARNFAQTNDENDEV